MKKILYSFLVISLGLCLHPLSLAAESMTPQKYIKDSEALWSGHTDQLPVCSLGATIGTHVGPGAIAVAFFSPQS